MCLHCLLSSKLCAPHKNDGIVKNALSLAIRSLAVNPRSARIRWPGFKKDGKSLFYTTGQSPEFPENPWETKLQVNGSMETKYLTVVWLLYLL